MQTNPTFILRLAFLALTFGAVLNKCYAEESVREIKVTKELPVAWERMNMDGGGFIEHVVVSPHDSDIVFALSDKGGIHRSRNGGITWEMCNKGLTRETFYGVADLVIHPEDPNVILVASGNAGWAYKHWCPGAIFRSEDGGDSWVMMMRLPFCGEGNPGKATAGGRLAIDPQHPDTVYAATFDKGLFKSTNFGKSWECIGLTDRFLTSILVDPENSDRLLATAWELPTINADRKGGLLESLDSGKTWTVLWEHPQTVSVTRAPFNADWLAASIDTDGIHLSLDRGKTWKNLAVPQGMSRVRLAKFQPSHASRLYVISGGEGSRMFYTDDFGETWTKAVTDFKNQLSYPENWYHYARRWAPFTSQSGLGDIVFDEKNPGRIFASDFFSVWRSDDDGRTYATHPTGLNSLCVYQVIPDPIKDGVIYVNNADIGILKSNDDGKTFLWPFRDDRDGAGDTLINETATLVISPVDSQRMAISVTVEWKKPRLATVLISNDGGTHWITRGTGIPQGTYVTGLLALDDNLDQLLVSAGCVGNGIDDVYYSPAPGEPFRRFAPGLPNQNGMIIGSPFNCPQNIVKTKDYVFVVTTQGLFRSALGEDRKWEKVDNGLTTTTLRSIASSPAAPRSVWVGTDNGVFCSDDDGESFRKITAPLMFECRGVAVDSTDPMRIFVAVASPWWVPGENAHGIYFSDNGGDSWKRLSDMPGEGMAWRLAIDPKDHDVIYVGCNGIGAWRTHLP